LTLNNKSDKIQLINAFEQKQVDIERPLESCRLVQGNGNGFIEFILLAVRRKLFD